MGNDIEKWLREDGKKVLKEIGVKEGQTVLDFGCGSGVYTLPAAEIVGAQGKVYASDKNQVTLDNLGQRSQSKKLRNIEIVKTSGNARIPLEDESVDMVFLYDVLHSYYFSAKERGQLLREAYRVLKPYAVLSVYPEHMESENIKRETEQANFQLETEYTETIIHDGKYTRAHIFNFRRPGR